VSKKVAEAGGWGAVNELNEGFGRKKSAKKEENKLGLVGRDSSGEKLRQMYFAWSKKRDWGAKRGGGGKREVEGVALGQKKGGL